MAKFNLGQTVCTRAIDDRLKQDVDFHAFINRSVLRHESGDWGDSYPEDAESNNEALEKGLRIFSVYKYDEETTVWIITEADRSYTTVLYPSEY